MLNRMASLAMSTSVLKSLFGKLDNPRHSRCILYISASIATSKSVLKALSGKLDIKRHSRSILYISASLTMSKSILKSMTGKLDSKRYSPSIIYILASLAMSTSVLKSLPGKLDIKDTHLVRASWTARAKRVSSNGTQAHTFRIRYLSANFRMICSISKSLISVRVSMLQFFSSACAAETMLFGRARQPTHFLTKYTCLG